MDAELLLGVASWNGGRFSEAADRFEDVWVGEVGARRGRRREGLTLVLAGWALVWAAFSALGILSPIVLVMAQASGTSVLAMGFVTAISSAFTYMTIIWSPANTIIFSSGYLQTKDYLRAGAWMTLASLLILWVTSETYWRMVLPR